MKPVNLTSAELGSLWSTYIANTLSRCVLIHFLEVAEDPDVKPLIEQSLHQTNSQILHIGEIFQTEGAVLPIGFTDSDVHSEAPRMYSDVYVLQYLKQVANIGMLTYSDSTYISAREDVRLFFNECLAASQALDNQTTQLLLNKGVYIRPPYISPPEKVEYTKEQSFLTGWLGERRPLTAVEITHLFLNILRNSLGKALLMGFSQSAQSKEVKEFFLRGKDMASKHIEIFSSLLREEDISAPSQFDSHVMTSTSPPFSDKLMLYHAVTLISTGIGNYGTSLSMSPRRDLTVHYNRLMAEVQLYAGDGMRLFIEEGWMEEPPQAVDREALATSK
ncbi:DUF3231 family protein [Ammoniphilus sp. CFH 90114]|uniref:DUF3231 family protein n=1 Tax=Ammoniphilus sp. CFH 90114 TaxID=2493665 RepID=UPI0013E92EAD|nr:DUF3231 family protein [Ammoniphilus sp. CFH 90114]